MIVWIRSIAGLIAGFAVASVVMMCMEYANAHVFYPGFAENAAAKDKEIIEEAEASGLAPDSREVLVQRRQAVREILAKAPVGALLVVMFGWVLGSVPGGFVAAWIAGRAPVVHGLVLGGLLTLAGVANNLMLPPPLWFWVGTLIVFVPSAYSGARLVPMKPMQPTAAASASA